MRQKIILRATQRQPDGAGGFLRVDADNASVMATIKIMSANERFIYERLDKNISHSVIVRNSQPIPAGSSITWQRTQDRADDVQLYVVTSVDPRPERPNEWLELVCREGGNL